MTRFVAGLVLGVMAALATTCLTTGDAVAQDLQQLLNRISRMERDLTDLQRQTFGGNTGGTGLTATPVTPTTLAPAPAGAATPPSTTAAGTVVNPSAVPAPGVGFAARAEIRLQQLEARIRNLTGKVEEAAFNLSQTSKRLNKLVADVDFRLTALERGRPITGTTNDGTIGSGAAPPAAAPATTATSSTATAPQPGSGKAGVFGTLTQSDVDSMKKQPGAQPRSQAASQAASQAGTQAATQAPAQGSTTTTAFAVVPAPAPAPSPKRLLPDGSAQDQYKFAFNLLRKQDFTTAEVAFKEFLELHPKDPLAANVTYWLGETFYVRGNYAQAAVTFAEGYKNFPASSKTADNLLKLGMALSKLDRKSDACFALARLAEQFPNASNVIKRRSAAEKKRIKCKN
ncbi:MAG: tol-pal system protein YbgF [Rhodospirillaceae bacterium]|nr:tol-pal system protein YbgF [Rhodospirillaceae bacterium]